MPRPTCGLVNAHALYHVKNFLRASRVLSTEVKLRRVGTRKASIRAIFLHKCFSIHKALFNLSIALLVACRNMFFSAYNWFENTLFCLKSACAGGKWITGCIVNGIKLDPPSQLVTVKKTTVTLRDICTVFVNQIKIFLAFPDVKIASSCHNAVAIYFQFQDFSVRYFY